MLKVNVNKKFPNDKNWYKSLSVQSIIGVVLVILGTSLYTGEFNAEYIAVLIGCVGAIVGRIRAKESLKWYYIIMSIINILQQM